MYTDIEGLGQGAPVESIQDRGEADQRHGQALVRAEDGADVEMQVVAHERPSAIGVTEGDVELGAARELGRLLERGPV